MAKRPGHAAYLATASAGLVGLSNRAQIKPSATMMTALASNVDILPTFRMPNPYAIGPMVWPMKKKNECSDSALARASTESSLANTCSGAQPTLRLEATNSA
jgi:hypothetical protein